MLSTLGNLQLGQSDRCRDVGEVGETLWEVAAHLAGVGVVFLGKETKVIAGPQSPFKCIESVLQLALVR